MVFHTQTTSKFCIPNENLVYTVFASFCRDQHFKIMLIKRKGLHTTRTCYTQFLRLFVQLKTMTIKRKGLQSCEHHKKTWCTLSLRLFLDFKLILITRGSLQVMYTTRLTPNRLSIATRWNSTIHFTSASAWYTFASFPVLHTDEILCAIFSEKTVSLSVKS